MAEGGRTYAVVGGGVAGLAAARLLAGLQPVSEASRAAGGARVVLIEQSRRLGGKVASGELAGSPVELGPDQFLRRDPSAERLCRQLGLGDRLVAPAGGTAGLLAKGELRPLPTGLVLGVPTDLAALAKSGIVSQEALAAARSAATRRRPFSPGELGLEGDPETKELSAGEILRPELGDEVVDYLVDPLLGGINAGRVDSLSLSVTAPGIAKALLRRKDVIPALRSIPSAPRPEGPSFLGLEGGLGALPAAVARELGAAAVELWLETRACGLSKSPGGYELETEGRSLHCDGVVLATPGGATGSLLSGLAPRAAELCSSIAYGDVSLVTFAFEAGSIAFPAGWTGFLVPARERKLMTAATFSSRKWPWMSRAGLELVRVSAGRFGDTRAGDLDDDELAARLLAELSELSGTTAPAVDRLVKRWPASFPQYRPGHRALIGEIRSLLPAGLALAGAALGGIGVPACISSGEAAAEQVLAAPRAA